MVPPFQIKREDTSSNVIFIVNCTFVFTIYYWYQTNSQNLLFHYQAGYQLTASTVLCLLHRRMRKSTVTTITQLGKSLPKPSVLGDSNLKKIAEIVGRNNGSELLSELKKMDSLAFKPSSSLFRSKRLSRSMTKIVADIYVSNRSASVEKACDALDCLQAVLPSARINGLADLINACIDKRHCSAAVSAYYKATEAGFYLDLLTQRRLVKLLCLEGRIDDLLSIIKASGVSAAVRSYNKLNNSGNNSHASIMDNCILYLAEPLIMSGCTEAYCDILVMYLQKRKSKWQQSSMDIAHVISSIIYAKIRRDTYHLKINPSEQAGIHRMLHALRCYHVDIAAECKASGVSVTSLQSYMATASLDKLDKDPMIVMDEMFLAMLPKVDLSGTHFPFLIEEAVDPLLAEAQKEELLVDPYDTKTLHASTDCDVHPDQGEDGEPMKLLVSDLTRELSLLRQSVSVKSSNGRTGKSGRGSAGSTGRQQVIEYHQRRRMHKQDLVALSINQSQSSADLKGESSIAEAEGDGACDAKATLCSADNISCKDKTVGAGVAVGAFPPQQRNILYHASLFPQQYADEIIDIRRGYTSGRQHLARMADVVAGQIMENLLSQPNSSLEISIVDDAYGDQGYDQDLAAGAFDAEQDDDEEDEEDEDDEDEDEDENEELSVFDEDQEDELDDEEEGDEDDEDGDKTEAEIIAMVNNLLGSPSGVSSVNARDNVYGTGDARDNDFLGRFDAKKFTGGQKHPLGNGRDVIYDHHRDHDSELYHDMRLIGFSNEHHNPADDFDFNDLTAGIISSLENRGNNGTGNAAGGNLSLPLEEETTAASTQTTAAVVSDSTTEYEPDEGNAGTSSLTPL